jgi:outer membrane lipoprotein
MRQRIFLTAAVFVLFVFAACTPISKQALSEVNTTATFQEIRSQPDSFLNKTVLWGGIVIDTTVRRDGSYVKVLQTSLDSEKRPKDAEKSGGRFIVYNRAFLDPAIYKNGTRITVVGTVTGKENVPLGEISYMYPVVEAKYIYVWKPMPRYYYYPPPFYPYAYPYPYWYWW